MPATTGEAWPAVFFSLWRSWHWREPRPSLSLQPARSLWLVSSPTNGHSSSRPSRCRTVERLARSRPPSATRDPVGHAPAAVPARGALGRLGRVGPEALAPARAAALPVDPDRLLQLRVGLRPAGLGGQGNTGGAQVRGEPGAPRQPRPQLRQGSRDIEPGQRPGPDPLSDEARRAAR